MSIIRKSLLSLVRSPLRTGAITIILAVSIGLALIMLTVHGATENQLGSVGEEIGTEITIRPAGSFGSMGGGEPLAEEDVDQLSDIAHVASVQESVQTQYTGDSLESAVDAGTLGTRPGGPRGKLPPGGFRMGIMVMGFDAATEDPDPDGRRQDGDQSTAATSPRTRTTPMSWWSARTWPMPTASRLAPPWTSRAHR